jgi:hypothetical protein
MRSKLLECNVGQDHGEKADRRYHMCEWLARFQKRHERRGDQKR